MLIRVRVVRLQMPNNIPQNAYMEHTVFPYSHLCGSAWGHEKKKEDRQINEREGEKEECSMSTTFHICEPIGNYIANQPHNEINL